MISDEIWRYCRKNFEVDGMSVKDIASMYGIGTASINRKIYDIADPWLKGIVPRNARLAAKAAVDNTKQLMAAGHIEEAVKEFTYQLQSIKLKEQNDYNTAVNQASLINNQTDLIDNFNLEEPAAVDNHHKLVTANKNLDNSSSGSNNNTLNFQQNTQINIYTDMTDDDLDRELADLESRL